MHTLKTSQAREKILSRIRSGLNKARLPLPFPEAEQENKAGIYSSSAVSPEEQFADEFIKLGGKFVYCENEQEFLDNIHNLYDSRGWEEVLCAEPEVLKKFENNRIPFVHPADPENSLADACITSCEALVARTGSFIISSKQHFGRTAPVFYPVHIVIAYPNQVVRDIADGLQLIQRRYGRSLPSMINLNTGPSRTADIEKTLVVGVHGPGEVFCFYINV